MPYNEIPDHPTIRNMEATGHPDGKEPEPVLCPLCGGECESLYRSREGLEILGCDLCVEVLEPCDYLE